MEAVSLFHTAAHWLLALIRLGAWFWLLMLLAALSGWCAWTVHHLLAGARRVLRRHGRRLIAPRTASERRGPVLRLGSRR